MDFKQIKARIDHYDRIIAGWEATLSELPEPIADELRLDINDLRKWRNQLHWSYQSTRRKKCGASSNPETR